MFTSRLIALRNKAKMSQEQMADKLNIARATYSKLESGKKSPTLDQLRTICNVLQVSIEDLTSNKPQTETRLNKSVQFDESEENSGSRPDVVEKVDSLREALLYILNRVGAQPNIGQAVLYKLLYFIDFDYYEKTGRSITGTRYIKNHFGPTPTDSFQDVIEEMKKRKEIEEVKVKYFKYEQVKYLPTIPPQFKHLSAEEVQHIDGVLKRLGDKSAKEISELSHRDMPWVATEDQQTIDYQLAMYRTAELSTETNQDEL